LLRLFKDMKQNDFQLEAGDIFCTFTPFQIKRPSTYLAPIIRFFTKYKYTHTAFVIECWGSLFVCEAFTSGIIIRPLNEFSDGMIVSVLRPSFKFDKKEISKKALSKVSTTKYDLISLLFFQILYQTTGKWYGQKKERKAEKKFYCSEYVAWLYGDVFEKWYMTTPEDIHINKNFKEVFVGVDHDLVKAQEKAPLPL
jgi:hypothetical protein